jgi:hypothetical protein
MTQGNPNPAPGFIPSPPPRRGRDWAGLWARFRVAALVLLCVGLAVASLLLYTSERRTTRQDQLTSTPEEIEALRLASLRWEAEFEQARQVRFELTEADIRLLEQALKAYDDYITARGSIGTDSVRQAALRRRLHLLRGEQLRADSVQAEERALALAPTDEEGAAALLRRAVACEAEIETCWDYSGLADPGRRARLDTRLRRLESGPLWRRSRAEEAAAEQAFAAARYVEAAAKFTQAIETENDFLARYRDVRDTEFGRVERLTLRRDTALSGPDWVALLGLGDQASAREKEGDLPGAARAWQAAIDGFTRFLATHPRSAFADRSEEAAWVVRLNRARLHAEIAQTRARCHEMRAALRARHVEDALRLIEDVLGRARRLHEAGTGLFAPGDLERQELDYLSEHAAALRGLLPAIDRQLIPLPGSPARMYRTEIPQGLYASVMGANPSSQRREANPVESVAYAEAEAFVLRLGWLLGSPARLPTVAEYRAALGTAGWPRPAAEAWTAENTDGVNARPVATAGPGPGGFHDLLGNVEEWAMVTAGDSRAPVVGGSVGEGRPKELPVRPTYVRDKSRVLGFRIVIE